MVRQPPFSALARAAAAAAVTVALGIAHGALLLGQERDRVLAREGEELHAAATAMAGRLEDGLSRWLADARALAATASLIEAAQAALGTLGAGREVLDALQRRSPEYAWIGIVRPSGVVATGAGGLLEGVDISRRPIFQGGVGGPFLGDIHTAVLLERLLRERRPDLGTAPLLFVDAAVPIHGAGGDGVAAIHIDWQWSVQTRDAVLAAFPGAASPDILVLDAAGRVVLGDGPTAEPDSAWLVAQAATGAIAGHPGLGWSVVARRERTAVLESLAVARSRFAAITLVASLAVALLAFSATALPWRRVARQALAGRMAD